MQNHSSPLLTDLYQLTMAEGYWKTGIDQKEAVFHYFFRKTPFDSGFVITAGLERLIQFIDGYRFTNSEIDYLSSLNLFDCQFLNILKTLKFKITLYAMPEGTVCFPFEPMIRVQAPLIQCQLLETILLNSMNFPSLIATKAARVKAAAEGDAVLEFGLRRAQGVDGGLTASRSAYVGGVDATSNLLAGKIYGIPVSGTQAHSWIMAFGDELEAFKHYAEVFPNNCILLVDTYNTLEGVKNAIEIGKILRQKNLKLLGIRLDSGDLAKLSIESRALLDQAGLTDCKIYASNELDEYLISDLKKQGSKITSWGIGTSLATGKDQAFLDGVYKLSAIRDPGKGWEYKLKLSEQLKKISNPGILQVRRYYNQNKAFADVIYDQEIGIGEFPEYVDPIDFTKRGKIDSYTSFKDLLQPIFIQGKKVYKCPKLQEIRKNTFDNLSQFDKELKRFLNPQIYPTGLEIGLQGLKLDLISKSRR